MPTLKKKNTSSKQPNLIPQRTIKRGISLGKRKEIIEVRAKNNETKN